MVVGCVGVYIDGFNLYYGGRRACGRSEPGWRWLDLRSLANQLISERRAWKKAYIARLVYCTARRAAAGGPPGFSDQDVYLSALKTMQSADVIELGHYSSRSKRLPIADPLSRRRSKLLYDLGDRDEPWLTSAFDNQGRQILLASVLVHEEKGSDVNVATHLLMDTLTKNVDCAIVVSNDSDLSLPLKIAREHVPVGLVNPGPGHIAGGLGDVEKQGAGGHWWRGLQAQDFFANQLANPAGKYRRPEEW